MQKHYVDPMFVFSMQFFVDVFVNNITVSIVNEYIHILKWANFSIVGLLNKVTIKNECYTPHAN